MNRGGLFGNIKRCYVSYAVIAAAISTVIRRRFDIDGELAQNRLRQDLACEGGWRYNDCHAFYSSWTAGCTDRTTGRTTGRSAYCFQLFLLSALSAFSSAIFEHNKILSHARKVICVLRMSMCRSLSYMILLDIAMHSSTCRRNANLFMNRAHGR